MEVKRYAWGYGREAPILQTCRPSLRPKFVLDKSMVQGVHPSSVYYEMTGQITTQPLLPAWAGRNIQRGSYPMRPGLTTTIQYPYESRTMSGQSIVRSKRFIRKWHPKYQVG